MIFKLKLQQTEYLDIYTEWNGRGDVQEDRITDKRQAQLCCALSKYGISNGTGREHIVTRNEKGNILSNRTERQIGQHASPIGGATRQIERNGKGEYIL